MYTYLHKLPFILPPPPHKISSQLISYLLKCLFSLTVDPPKNTEITQHPENKSVATGASTTLTVKAFGDDLQFQWRKDGKDLHDGSKYRGTKTCKLHIKDVKKSDKENYQCLVKNDVGELLTDRADLAISKFINNLILFCKGNLVW